MTPTQLVNYANDQLETEGEEIFELRTDGEHAGIFLVDHGLEIPVMPELKAGEQVGVESIRAGLRLYSNALENFSNLF